MVLRDKRWYRPDELAEELGEPLRNVYFWLQHDAIKHIHVGRKIKISREELDRLMAKGTVAPVTNCH